LSTSTSSTPSRYQCTYSPGSHTTQTSDYPPPPPATTTGDTDHSSTTQRPVARLWHNDRAQVYETTHIPTRASLSTSEQHSADVSPFPFPHPPPHPLQHRRFQHKPTNMLGHGNGRPPPYCPIHPPTPPPTHPPARVVPLCQLRTAVRHRGTTARTPLAPTAGHSCGAC
jgi:hypothetical protein